MGVWPVATGLTLSSPTNTRQESKANFSARGEISLHNSNTRQNPKRSADTLNSVSFDNPGESQRSNTSSRG